MTTLFEMASALARADAAMLQEGVSVRTRAQVLDAMTTMVDRMTTISSTDLPDWRREELARKYAPVDAYEPDDMPDEYQERDDKVAEAIVSVMNPSVG